MAKPFWIESRTAFTERKSSDGPEVRDDVGERLVERGQRDAEPGKPGVIINGNAADHDHRSLLGERRWLAWACCRGELPRECEKLVVGHPLAGDRVAKRTFERDHPIVPLHEM